MCAGFRQRSAVAGTLQAEQRKATAAAAAANQPATRTCSTAAAAANAEFTDVTQSAAVDVATARSRDTAERHGAAVSAGAVSGFRCATDECGDGWQRVDTASAATDFGMYRRMSVYARGLHKK